MERNLRKSTKKSNVDLVVERPLNYGERQFHVERLANALKRGSLYKQSWCEETCRHLPDPVLLKIFSYLSVQDRLRVAAVCRKWRQISLDPSLWRKLDLSSNSPGDNFNIGDRNIIFLTTHVSTSAIREIILSSRACRNITNISLLYITRYCHKLRLLSVSSRKITDTGLQVLAENGNCSNLKVLELEKCVKITTMGFVQVLRNLAGLEKVSIAGNKWVQRGVLNEIAQCCSSLKSLNIEGCKEVADTELEILTSGCPNLTHINLRNTWSLTNSGIERFLKKIPILETLEIGIVRKSRTNFEVLNAVADNCANLVTLDYQDCNAPKLDDVICHVAHGCPKLQKLAVRQYQAMSNDTLNTLKAACPRLRSIDHSIRFYDY